VQFAKQVCRGFLLLQDAILNVMNDLVESSYEAKRVVLRLQQRLMMINEFRDISFGSRRIEHSACCDGDYPDCHFRVGIFLQGEN
jgi:hypothetical protein